MRMAFHTTHEVALIDDELRELIKGNQIRPCFDMAEIDLELYVQPASIDIPLGSICYLMRDKVIPYKQKVKQLVRGDLVLEKKYIEQNGVVLLRGNTYLFPCGHVNLAKGQRGSLSPKSSIGRVDLMVRGIFDYCGLYDTVQGEGELWLEVSPRSFNVRVKPCVSLSQMMVFEERTCEAPLGLRIYQENKLAFDTEGCVMAPQLHSDALVLSLNLDVTGTVGYEAKPNSEVVDLSKVRAHNWEKWFRPIAACPEQNTITLEKDKFYILSTKERISVPLHLSAEMIPFSQHVGELRAHYAGFFDPGFGFGEDGEICGTVGVLEVRPHETMTIYDGQPICLMKFFTNSKKPTKPYGLADNNYQQQQGPKLAKYFQ
mmetsp:Transcript_18254/g.39640  ORF Transcript_18254/g.39640 Transcript_18254/m.39640 type:complete len:373 (+) Transcript_18254:1-1119(+)